MKKNGFVAVSFDYDVPASATMNINSKGAKAVFHKGAAIQADVIKAGDTAIFGYDGTNYVLVSSSSGDVSGTVTVSLVPVVSGSQYAASLLNGVTVELWNVSDNKTVETKTWAGSQLSFTKVMAAPGMTPMSRKCWRSAPSPPTVRITADSPCERDESGASAATGLSAMNSPFLADSSMARRAAIVEGG